MPLWLCRQTVDATSYESMPPPFPQRKSTLSAQKHAAANRSLGELIVSPPARKPAKEPDRSWDGGQSLLIPGISAFDLPPTLKGRSAVSAADGLADERDQRRRGQSGDRADNRAARSTARSSSRSVSTASKRKRARNPATSAHAPARRLVEWQDHLVVSSLVAVFVLVAVGLGFVQVRGGMVKDRSKTGVVNTLAVVHQEQAVFRATNQRFATWEELRDRGARIGPTQEVVASNASASHWFISVRDNKTGITCSRTGELFDEGPTDRPASCAERAGP